MTINETYKMLNQTDKDCLKFAFDNLIAQYVKLPDNKFIGVHCGDDPGLIVEETNGYWFRGNLK